MAQRGIYVNVVSAIKPDTFPPPSRVYLIPFQDSTWRKDLVTVPGGLPSTMASPSWITGSIYGPSGPEGHIDGRHPPRSA